MVIINCMFYHIILISTKWGSLIFIFYLFANPCLLIYKLKD